MAIFLLFTLLSADAVDANVEFGDGDGDDQGRLNFRKSWQLLKYGRPTLATFHAGLKVKFFLFSILFSAQLVRRMQMQQGEKEEDEDAGW